MDGYIAMAMDWQFMLEPSDGCVLHLLAWLVTVYPTYILVSLRGCASVRTNYNVGLSKAYSYSRKMHRSKRNIRIKLVLLLCIYISFLYQKGIIGRKYAINPIIKLYVKFKFIIN